MNTTPRSSSPPLRSPEQLRGDPGKSEPVPTPQLAEAEIRALAERALGVPVSATAPLAGSVGNQNLRLDTERGRFSIKLAAESELAGERWGLERAAEAGVPVPRVAAAGELGGDRGFMITGWVPGGPATVADTEALVEAGRAIRRYHEVGGPGYGLADVEAGAARGRFGSWAERLADIVAKTEPLVRHGVITAELADGFRAAVDDHADAIAYDGEGVLLHCDLKPAHLFVADGRLSSIIDWGDTSYGDPRYDLARLSVAEDAIFRPALEGYGLELEAELSRTLACYRAIQRVDALHYELMAGGDWFDVYRQTIIDWLAPQRT
ncbi:phosphotransferase family protein [Microlunatus parietis]|uniref:Aminoglycoside phosphotransferase (APT) family kinase protein n=1 Tax=Microlunatus parietis TaxID=682979 RepID=A0A7Y9I9V1_9ACTN|nr:aminoglycoside phosphotransferase family protein [Microlunatus parietis]NYE72636.1 aminoglycoside phosphotransferase (APT) family kinase protein [Microlunatus parietis]